MMRMEPWSPGPYSKPSRFHMVIMGVGGTGGAFVQGLGRLLYGVAHQPDRNPPEVSVTLWDGDRVEEHNLGRQPFVPQDIGKAKATVLANRFGGVYALPWDANPHYIETAEEVLQVLRDPYSVFPMLVGCVDNHPTRKILHEAFQMLSRGLYVDCGNDGVAADNPETSGYSGQCVVGLRWDNKEILPPVGGVYPDILTDTSAPHPTAACGVQAVNEPQRLITNLWSAQAALSIVNTFIATGTVRVRQVDFNALNDHVRPTYVTRAS